MKKRKFKSNYWDSNDLDLELFFATEVLKLDSLHYGFWNPGEKLTLENLRKAQNRYTETLLELIPVGVKQVLDVGCGIGDISQALAQKNYKVVAISPDKNHAKFFDKEVPRITFHNSKFEDFQTSDLFDLILMSESQNYFDKDVGLKRSNQLTKPGSYLLISGMFKKPSDSSVGALHSSHSLESEYIEKAGNYGFKLVKRVDITEQVIPTLQLARQAMDKHIPPISEMFDSYLKSRSPLKYSILKLVFRKQIKDYEKAVAYYKKRTDVPLFKKNVNYLRLLFQHQTQSS